MPSKKCAPISLVHITAKLQPISCIIITSLTEGVKTWFQEGIFINTMTMICTISI